MKKTFLEEKDYLKKTLIKFDEVIENNKLKLESLPRVYKDNIVQLEKLLKQYGNKMIVLEKTRKKPYFARIDFKDDSELEVSECYIGKVGVMDEDNNLVTVDWRAPIASLYYDSNVGKAKYHAPQGETNGELLLKRQYDIEEGELLSFQDVDTVSNDEMLKPYLGVNTDNRLKNIVSTIQAEQNEIIREDIHNNMVIQGVAGSGKTTVALHRIAYLVYNNIKNINPEQYLVIGPNKFFVNYISGVLPDLDVNNVLQLTYDEIVKELIKEDFELLSDEDNLIKSIDNIDELKYERYKVSMNYKELLDKFLIDFDKKIVPNEDFIIKGYKILPRNVISKIYDSIIDDVISYEVFAKKIERACLLISKYISEQENIIFNSIQEEFHEKAPSLSPKDLDKERKNIEFIKKELKNNCNQSLKKYFSNGRPKILNLYIELLKNINEVDENTNINKDIENIKKKKVHFEDLGALLYLYYRIYGSSNFFDIRHAVIDEAQDFGELNFYVLKKLMPNSTFSIFGDLAQSIYEYRGINNWNEVIDITFKNECELKYLKKSYRTTTEIMNSANNIIRYIGMTESEPVIRHGVEVNYIKLNNNKIKYISNIINKYLEKGYKSIAIICKDCEESNYINSKLKEQGIEVSNITNLDLEYNGGICTITSYLAKGLEFDGVIISDASEGIYDSSKKIDMKILYVAMTRSLHELNILYNNELVIPLQNDLK